MTATVTNLNGQTQEWKDPRKHLVGLWRLYFKAKRGQEPNFTWGGMMNMMVQAFETTDIKTGEIFIEYPEEENWNQETEGFFDSQFGFTARYSFSVFLSKKCYGGWFLAQKRPVNQLLQGAISTMNAKPAFKDPNEKYRCRKCNQIHSEHAPCLKEVPDNHHHL